MYLSYEHSKKDPYPAKWQALGTLYISVEQGEDLRIELFSTGSHDVGAFAIGEQYYRGGLHLFTGTYSQAESRNSSGYLFIP